MSQEISGDIRFGVNLFQLTSQDLPRGQTGAGLWYWRLGRALLANLEYLDTVYYDVVQILVRKFRRSICEMYLETVSCPQPGWGKLLKAVEPRCGKQPWSSVASRSEWTARFQTLSRKMAKICVWVSNCGCVHGLSFLRSLLRSTLSRSRVTKLYKHYC